MKRILEPELMDTPEAATEYDGMDHAEVNRQFAEEFLAFAKETCAEGLDAVAWEVLDVGTGTARLPIELCKINADINVVAIDDAVSMLAVSYTHLTLPTIYSV